MTRSTCNLIRDMVPSAARRRRRYHAMLVWLGACGLILVGVAYSSASRIEKAIWQQREAAQLEQLLKETRPQASGIEPYALDLRSRLENARNRLRKTDAVLAERTAHASILLGLAEPLPRGVFIRKFEFDREKGVFEFELFVPLAASETGSPDRFLATWLAREDLMRHLATISALRSARQKYLQDAYYTMSFSATLRKQGKG